MAYIFRNGDKYYPIKDFGDDLLDIAPKDGTCFEVDELMAVVIAKLCNKGYITEMSCSGHSIHSPGYVLVSRLLTLQEIVKS